MKIFDQILFFIRFIDLKDMGLYAISTHFHKSTS